MMYNCIKFFTLICCIGLISCQKETEDGLYSIYQLDKYKNPKPIVAVDTMLWKKQLSLMSNFPRGIEVYKSNQTINGMATNMYIVGFNPKLIDFKPVMSTAAKTPSAFFEDEPGEVYACINGGYFGPSVSYSLVMYNGTTSAVNIKSLNRTFNNVSTAYYPTRAAFGLNKDFKPSVSWVYSVGAGNGVLYSYLQPSPNEEGKAPQAVPTATFPSGGSLWQQHSAIGGSPMLVKDSVINVTDIQEMVTASATTDSSRPRSAIGHLKNGNIVMLAVEGGSTEIPGLTLPDLAKVMLQVGCVGAINLDGGGSSSMVVDGRTTIKPTDAAGERKVVSAILVKKR